MLTIYGGLLLMVVCGATLFAKIKVSPKRQGICFLILGVISLVRAVGFFHDESVRFRTLSERFHVEPVPFRTGAIWFWLVAATIQIIGGLYVLNKSRKNSDKPLPPH